MRHQNDHTRFSVPSIVILKLDTAELHLIDKVSFGFGSSDSGRPIDPKLIESAGFEILGELGAPDAK